MLEIGLDRVLLKNLKIRQMNGEILKINKFILIRDTGNPERLLLDEETGEIVGVNYIKVSNKHQDILLNELTIGVKEVQGYIITRVEYEHLDITLPAVISNTKTNERNISNKDDLFKVINLIEEELQELGFGKVELLDAELKEMELNINIELKNDFKEYEQVIRYVNELLPKRMKSRINEHYKVKEEYTGFTAGNGSVSLKIYDKRKDLIEKKNRDITKKELLRIEYTLLNEQKIKSIFGTNVFKGIIEDFNQIEKAFRTMILNDLVKRIYKDINRQIRHAKRQIKAYKSNGGISAVDRYLKNYSGEILDIGIILEALRSTETSRHYARISRKAMKSGQEIEDKNLFGNIGRLNELLRALNYEEIKIDTTPTIRKEYKEITQ